MKRKRTAVMVPVLSLAVLIATGSRAEAPLAPKMTVKLDNARVTVTESLTPEGGRREPYTRPTDQLLVFLDEAEYDSVDGSGKATHRKRAPGDLVWHAKGEAAPLLVNKGKAYRNLVIAFK